MAAKIVSLALTPEIEAKWTPAQVDLIRSMSAKNCTDDEFKVLLYVANSYNLDPLTKQIYAQKYQGNNPQPAAIIITYAGMLEIANRGNMLDGLSSEIIYAPDGVTVKGARSTLWKKGGLHPFITEVDIEEYFQYDRSGKPMGLWGTKTKTMIRKVSCAQNIRQAFSLGQMYIEEEMPQPQDITPAPLPASRQDTGSVRELSEMSFPVINKPAIAKKVMEETVELGHIEIETPTEAEVREIPEPKTIAEVAPDLQSRYGKAQLIKLVYNIQTVDKTGEWAKDLQPKAVLKALDKMLGAKTFPEAAKIMGAESLAQVTLTTYPELADADQSTKFAAMIHVIYDWMNKVADAEAEVANASPK